MEERRKAVRRVADRELQQKAQQLQAMADRRALSSAEQEAAEKRKRHAIRHNCKVAIKMLIGHAAGSSDSWSVDAIKVDGRVLDLSAGGASLFTKQPFETGQELRLTIQLRDGSKINTNALIRWIKSIPQKGGYASGVQFVEVSEKDRRAISKFLVELSETSGL
jgi:c-di-GMP-binding flagellar brake protein YcgR